MLQEKKKEGEKINVFLFLEDMIIYSENKTDKLLGKLKIAGYKVTSVELPTRMYMLLKIGRHL